MNDLLAGVCRRPHNVTRSRSSRQTKAGQVDGVKPEAVAELPRTRGPLVALVRGFAETWH